MTNFGLDGNLTGDAAEVLLYLNLLALGFAFGVIYIDRIVQMIAAAARRLHLRG